MGIKRLLQNISGIGSNGGKEPLHPIKGMMFGKDSVILKCAAMTAFEIPLSNAYMTLNHLGAWFMINPGATDKSVEGVQDIEVQRYLDYTWIIRCNNYMPDMERAMPDCWGFDTPFVGDIFWFGSNVYAKKSADSVTMFSVNGEFAYCDLKDDNVTCDIPNDNVWYQCSCYMDGSQKMLRSSSKEVLKLGEAISGLREVPIQTVKVGQFVVVKEEDVCIVERSEDTRDGYMLWLKGNGYGMWYAQPTIRLVSQHEMLPKEYDAKGDVVKRYNVKFE